jgi:ferredoxin--NADP+ reductase
MTIETTILAPRPANVHVAGVLEVRHYTDGLFAFTCERPASFRFRSGEFVMIGLMNGAKPLLRAYSIASPAWDETLAFYSIKVADGPLTSRLQHLEVGDAILLGRKPTGTLVLDALKPGRRLFLLSTGTGVAPFASLIRDPETYERFDQVILTHTCRRADEIRYSREQAELAFADPLVGDEAQSKLKLVTSLTRDQHTLTGRITDLIDDGRLFAAAGLGPLDAAQDRVMICGSTPMLNDLGAIMLKRGFAEGANSAPGDFVYERAFVGR